MNHKIYCYRSNLFLGMVMYDNEFETQKNKKSEPRIKLNYNLYVVVNFSS